jgi:hypothetical protein
MDGEPMNADDMKVCKATLAALGYTHEGSLTSLAAEPTYYYSPKRSVRFVEHIGYFNALIGTNVTVANTSWMRYTQYQRYGDREKFLAEAANVAALEQQEITIVRNQP